MSARNFARAFRAETGVTPGRLRRGRRASSARGASSRPPTFRSRPSPPRCGFGTAETMRRAFAPALGVTPAAYRDRFAA